MPPRPIFRFSLAVSAAIASAALNSTLLAQSLEQDPYYIDGQRTLELRKEIKPNKRRAKNVILFLADGMDPTTVAAARIYDGQQSGAEGEENYLSFERFPHIAMAKTYTTDAQTPDSAGTMSAIVTGIKTRSGVLSVNASVTRGDCASSLTAAVPTLGELAERAGMATGIISTARITHATPAAVYAHGPDRNWEADSDLPDEAQKEGCRDIAQQLIDFKEGDGLEVVMGGGRRNFLPETSTDPESDGGHGRRRDGQDLTAAWKAKSDQHQVVFDRAGFDALPARDVKVLGLFEASHMEYEADRADDVGGEPSLTEMTIKAIEILSQNKKQGYLLVVEAGRVDHAHHAGNAARALHDTQEFSQAIAAAKALTNDKDTLIIATADHGHTIAFQGYPSKGNNILGLTDGFYYGKEGAVKALDGKHYPTLAYANGPGASYMLDEHDHSRPNPSHDDVKSLDYKQPAAIPTPSETHGGQDVTVYASGPHAYLFGGVVEQSYIFHVIENALNLNKRAQ